MPARRQSIKTPTTNTSAKPHQTDVSFDAILHTLPSSIVVLDKQFLITYINPAAEDLLGVSLQALHGREIARYVYPITHILKLLNLVRDTGQSIREFDLTIAGPRFSGDRKINVQISPIHSHASSNFEHILMQIDLSGTAPKIGAAGGNSEHTQSMSAMAAILAHEVKNPLSGIRGAAQLLEKHVIEQHKGLTHLIRDEVDRITALINEMEVFSNESTIKTSAVNIHEVLQYVKSIAENGFAKGVIFKEIYDPSLPPVLGNHDMLVQLFLNLVKNASEATQGREKREIHLITAYSGGFKFKPVASEDYVLLPVTVCIDDTGSGIAPEIKPYLFNPFISSKQGGKGLGLSVVSKIVSDHSGTIDIEETPSGLTRFKILLPATKE